MMTAKQKRQAKLEAKLEARHNQLMAAEMARLISGSRDDNGDHTMAQAGSWDGQNRDNR